MTSIIKPAGGQVKQPRGLPPAAGHRYNRLRRFNRPANAQGNQSAGINPAARQANPHLPWKHKWTENGLIGPKPSKSGSCNYGTLFDLAGKKAKTADLERQMAAEGFWNNRERAQELVVELKGLKAVIRPLEETVKLADDLAALVEMAAEDQDLAAEVPPATERLEKTLDELDLQSLLNGPLDGNSALLTINARDGGTDANDWAEMLLRMYLAWAKDHDYQTELLDRQDNEEAGINSATIAVRGPLAYGYLKGEAGIHRLVRISPFNAEGKRQTSFAAVDVAPEVSDQIQIELRDEDIREDVFRASGAGGQHVNKTDSAVRMTHFPSGIVVSCQNERSQHKNRAMAMKILRARLFELELRKQREKLEQFSKEKKEITWGSQIRSYVLQPYRMVKDHRTGVEIGNTDAVLDGDIDRFIEAYLLGVRKEGAESPPA